MSRIGNRKVVVPAGVTVTNKNNVVTVKGPKGELSLDLVKGIEVNIEENTLTGKISSINSAVKEGNSVYYFKLEGDDHIYIADLSLSNSLPLVQAGNEVEIHFISNEHQSVVISQFKAK